MLISAPMLLNLRQMPIGVEPIIFQPSPVVHGPNPYLTHYPLYVIVWPRNLFQSIARTRFSRNTMELSLTVFELWPFEI